MRFDTFNFTLVGLAALLLGLAAFRSHTSASPRPKNPIGFQP